jgi:hypothetical protein
MEQVVDQFKRQIDDEVVRYVGDCSICGHLTAVDIPRPPQYDDLDLLEVKPDDEKPAAPTPDSARHSCSCREEHDGRPPDRVGCGVYGFAYVV